MPKASKGRLKFTKKWWVPYYMFNGRQYPSMVSGSGYLMDYDSARCIFKEVMKLPYFHLEVSSGINKVYRVTHLVGKNLLLT